MVGQRHIEDKIICKPGQISLLFNKQKKTFFFLGQTRNAALTLPKEFPIGGGELTINGTGGLHFEEKRDIIVYDNCHIILVQTSASTYRPDDIMEIRVVATNENLMPIEYGELIVEIYVNFYLFILIEKYLF